MKDKQYLNAFLETLENYVRAFIRSASNSTEELESSREILVDSFLEGMKEEERE